MCALRRHVCCGAAAPKPPNITTMPEQLSSHPSLTHSPHPQRTPAGTAACHLPPASPLTHRHASPEQQTADRQSDRQAGRQTGGQAACPRCIFCWLKLLSSQLCAHTDTNIRGCCGCYCNVGVTHVTPAEACVDGLVHVNHVGLHIPAVWVVIEGHVVVEGVGAILCRAIQTGIRFSKQVYPIQSIPVPCPLSMMAASALSGQASEEACYCL